MSGRAVRGAQISWVSQNEDLQFVRMSEACSGVTGVSICAWHGSTTASGSYSCSDCDIIVPSSVFFPSLAGTRDVTRAGIFGFGSGHITSILILRHVRILCSDCFSDCKSLSSISFETDSIDTHRIKSISLLSFSRINHNSSSRSNSLFIMLFILPITFIDLI
jgi:hypothetical protein